MNEVIEAVPVILIYEANDSLYKVVKATTQEDEEISLVGYFPNLVLNLPYQFEGEMTTHPKFGSQFKVKTYKRLDANTKSGVVEYLVAKCRGVGVKSAEKIYDTLGPKSLDLIIENPNVLKAIKGFSDEKIRVVYEDLKENLGVEKIFVELYSYGLTPIMANKLYQAYGEATMDLIKSNPYRLIYEVDGFGFSKADHLAISLGFSFGDSIRVEEGILFTLNEVCNNNGYCFLTEDQLVNSALLTLNKGATDGDMVLIDKISDALISLMNKNRIILEDGRYYPYYLYNAEVSVAKKVLSLNTPLEHINDLSYVSDRIKDVEKTFDIEYNMNQKEAILNAINSKISIITGGPGTGKTTIIKGLINILASLEHLTVFDDKFRNRVLLLAPTGRAAKRLGNACGMPASTIHKGLGYNYELEFEFNEDNKLYEDIIIIDEFSMVDICLADNLFKAIKDNARVIIVGDSNQLPSVSSGNVLHDLIESGLIKTTALHEIMRQQIDSPIIKLSQMVVNQDIRMSIFNDKKEIFFFPADASLALDRIMQFVGAFIKKGGNLLTELQILIPMYSGPCGINEVNRQIQARFNLNEDMLVRGDRIFKKLDKVLQLKNNPELGIMNGDIGYITEIIKGEDHDYLIIDFDSLKVKYPSSELDNLTLAYAISVHKSQGSEYDNVIMPVLPSYYKMLKKNLIYTGFTRAKNKLIVIGSEESLCYSVTKNDDIRQTTLMHRILNKTEMKKGVIYINDPSIPFDTLGEEGMDGITPYNFM